MLYALHSKRCRGLVPRKYSRKEICPLGSGPSDLSHGGSSIGIESVAMTILEQRRAFEDTESDGNVDDVGVLSRGPESDTGLVACTVAF